MTIRLTCPENHSQDVVLDPSRIGSSLAAGFIAKYGDEIAALIDGTSKMYTVPPPQRRCQCGKPFKAQVVES